MSQKRIISILAAVAILALGLFLLFRATPASAIRSVVEQQFVAISVADFEKAHTFLAKEKRDVLDKDGLRYYVAGHSLLESNVKRTYKDVIVQEGGTTATAYVDVENVTGEKGGINVFLAKEGSDWKISSYDFISADVTGQK